MYNIVYKRWRCHEGHEWEATPYRMKQRVEKGYWCRECAGRPLVTIEQMQALAKAHDGVCVSTSYVTGRTKLRWRCAEGHEWDAIPGNLRNRGSWCPKCAGLAPLTLDEMQRIAKDRGGVCLSTTYVNYRAKLRWRCSEGHEWEAKPMDMRARVKRGRWCTKCPRVAQRRPPALDISSKIEPPARQESTTTATVRQG